MVGDRPAGFLDEKHPGGKVPLALGGERQGRVGAAGRVMALDILDMKPIVGVDEKLSEPLTVADQGEVALAGRYPNRTELARWAGILATVTDIKGAGSCCSGSKCC